MSSVVIAFMHNEQGASPDILALGAANIDALSEERKTSGLSVRLCDAQIINGEVWIPADQASDLEKLQHFFIPVIRVVSRRELLKRAFAKQADIDQEV